MHHPRMLYFDKHKSDLIIIMHHYAEFKTGSVMCDSVSGFCPTAAEGGSPTNTQTRKVKALSSFHKCEPCSISLVRIFYFRGYAVPGCVARCSHCHFFFNTKRRSATDSQFIRFPEPTIFKFKHKNIILQSIYESNLTKSMSTLNQTGSPCQRLVGSSQPCDQHFARTLQHCCSTWLILPQDLDIDPLSSKA